MKYQNKYLIHVDNLRIDRNFRVPDFCEDICSERQYRRYLVGEQKPTQNKMLMFFEKLGLTAEEFYSSFHVLDKEEYLELFNIYTLASSGDFENAYRLIQEVELGEIIDLRNSQLYQYCMIYLELELKKITKYYALDRYCKLINYPTNKVNGYFSFIDVITLRRICLIEFEIDKNIALDLLYEILTNRDKLYLSGFDRQPLPTIYQSVAKIYGLKNNIGKCLELSLKGISESLLMSNTSSLQHLYYYVSLCYKKTHNYELSEKYARLCIATCIAKQDTKALKLFSETIYKDQGLNFSFDTTYKKNTSN